MHQILLIIHTIVTFLLIALVLVQQGKGAEAGASFGAGASNTMFGSKGATPFLAKVTATLAMLFFSTSLTLTYLDSQQGQQSLLQVRETSTQSEKESDKDQKNDVPMRAAAAKAKKVTSKIHQASSPLANPKKG